MTLNPCESWGHPLLTDLVRCQYKCLVTANHLINVPGWLTRRRGRGRTHAGSSWGQVPWERAGRGGCCQGAAAASPLLAQVQQCCKTVEQIEADPSWSGWVIEVSNLDTTASSPQGHENRGGWPRKVGDLKSPSSLSWIWGMVTCTSSSAAKPGGEVAARPPVPDLRHHPPPSCATRDTCGAGTEQW